MKILITDDHKMFTEGVKRLITDEFVNVEFSVSLNGKEAIEMCNSIFYDLVIMDISMPVIDGIHATQEIRRRSDKTKIVILSMNADSSSVAKAFKAGANGFVLKSEGPEDLLKAIKYVLSGKSFISKNISEFFELNINGQINIKENLIRFSENLISSREREVLKLICEGQTNEKIANVLSISVRTVDTHRTNMLTKLKLPNTAALVRFAVENKLI